MERAGNRKGCTMINHPFCQETPSFVPTRRCGMPKILGLPLDLGVIVF